jgi:predicted glycoside hydrolase/deacetylase ChbG (UPF0249 family)
MAPKLILNADDFGLTPGVNRSIAELYAAGALTSATLMANGSAFDEAIAIARANPALGIGCHIVLTDGVPLSPPHTVPSLLAENGQSFRPSLASFLLAVLSGKVNHAEVALEASAQIARIQACGIRVTHVDTHKHTHILPGIARPLLQVAERLNVPAIRNPFEQPWSLRLGQSPLLRRLQLEIIRRLRPRFLALPQIRDRRVVTTDGTVGISATGHLNPDTLAAILRTMPNGIWELVCHPGYNDPDLDAITTRLRQSREIERSALLSAFSSPEGPAIELLSYANLPT